MASSEALGATGCTAAQRISKSSSAVEEPLLDWLLSCVSKASPPGQTPGWCELQMLPGLYGVAERDLPVISQGKVLESVLVLASCLPATEPGSLVQNVCTHTCVCGPWPSGDLALRGRLVCRTFAEALWKEGKEARLGIGKAGLQCRLKEGLS